MSNCDPLILGCLADLLIIRETTVGTSLIYFIAQLIQTSIENKFLKKIAPTPKAKLGRIHIISCNNNISTSILQ